MQNIIVVLVLLAAAFFVGKRLVQAFRPGKNTSCGCGCSGCSTASSCSSAKKS